MRAQPTEECVTQSPFVRPALIIMIIISMSPSSSLTAAESRDDAGEQRLYGQWQQTSNAMGKKRRRMSRCIGSCLPTSYIGRTNSSKKKASIRPTATAAQTNNGWIWTTAADGQRRRDDPWRLCQRRSGRGRRWRRQRRSTAADGLRKHMIASGRHFQWRSG